MKRFFGDSRKNAACSAKYATHYRSLNSTTDSPQPPKKSASSKTSDPSSDCSSTCPYCHAFHNPIAEFIYILLPGRIGCGFSSAHALFLDLIEQSLRISPVSFRSRRAASHRILRVLEFQSSLNLFWFHVSHGDLGQSED